MALIYLKRLYLGIKEKLHQLQLLRFIESSPNSFEMLQQSNSKLSERISTMSANRQPNAPTFLGVGINFGEYFPSGTGKNEDTHSCKSDEKFEQLCDHRDYNIYFVKPKMHPRSDTNTPKQSFTPIN